MDILGESKNSSRSRRVGCVHSPSPRPSTEYAGITNRLADRFAAHQAGKGAKFTRAHPPLRILGARPYADRSEASKAEYAIKKLPRARKLAFISTEHEV